VDLSDLATRLKRNIADAVSRAAAGLVNSAVTIALNGSQKEEPLAWTARSDDRSWRYHEPRSWSFGVLREEDSAPEDEEGDPWRGHGHEPEVAFDDPRPMREPVQRPAQRKWLEPVLAVLQALILWLRNRRAPLPLIGLGAGVAGLLAFVIGGSSGPVTVLLAITEILLAGSALLRAS
jgi:hypothetical protein